VGHLKPPALVDSLGPRPVGSDHRVIEEVHGMSRIDDIVAGARDSATVQRVFGEPYEKNGVTFIPAAAVRGGAGGGEGEGGEDQPSGGGGGFGVTARPVGAYRIKDDEVTWIPAIDATRVAIMGQLVGIVALLVLRSIIRTKKKHKA
jgi:uncharacterized spore protein YtfJ